MSPVFCPAAASLAVSRAPFVVGDGSSKEECLAFLEANPRELRAVAAALADHVAVVDPRGSVVKEAWPMAKDHPCRRIVEENVVPSRGSVMRPLSQLSERARDLTLRWAIDDLVVDLYGLEVLKRLSIDRRERRGELEIDDLLRSSGSWDEGMIAGLAKLLTTASPESCALDDDPRASSDAEKVVVGAAHIEGGASSEGPKELLRGLLLAGQEFWISPVALDELRRLASEGVLCTVGAGIAEIVQSQLCRLPADAVGDVLAAARTDALVLPMLEAQSECYGQEAQVEWLGAVASNVEEGRLLGAVANTFSRDAIEDWLGALGCGELREVAEDAEDHWQAGPLGLLDAELAKRHGDCSP